MHHSLKVAPQYWTDFDWINITPDIQEYQQTECLSSWLWLCLHLLCSRFSWIFLLDSCQISLQYKNEYFKASMLDLLFLYYFQLNIGLKWKSFSLFFFNELLSPTLVEAGKTRDHRFCFPCDFSQTLTKTYWDKKIPTCVDLCGCTALKSTWKSCEFTNLVWVQLLYFSTLQKLLLKYRAWQLQVAIFAFGEMVCDFPHEDSQSDFKSPLDKTIFCNDKNWTVR